MLRLITVLKTCWDTMMLVLMTMMMMLTFVETASTFDGRVCEASWSFYGRHCFYIVLTEQMDFHKALERCHALGADLASIHTESENKALVRMVTAKIISQQGMISSSSVWTGLVYHPIIPRISLATWTDGTALDFTQSSADGPRSWRDICVTMKPHSASWYRSSCEAKHGYICKRDPGNLTKTSNTWGKELPQSTTPHYGSKSEPLYSTEAFKDQISHSKKCVPEGDSSAGLTGGEFAGVILSALGGLASIAVVIYVIRFTNNRKATPTTDTDPFK